MSFLWKWLGIAFGVTFLSSLLLSAPASAATAFESRIDKQVSGFVHTRGLFGCLAQTDDANFSLDQALNGQWDLDGDDSSIGPYASGVPVINCKDAQTSITKGTLEKAGIAGDQKVLQFLCRLDARDGEFSKRKNENGGSTNYERCLKASGEFDDLPGGVRWESFRDSIRSNSETPVAELPLDDLSPIQKYHLAFKSLMVTCGGKPADPSISTARENVINVSVVTNEGGKLVTKQVPYELSVPKTAAIPLFMLTNHNQKSEISKVPAASASAFVVSLAAYAVPCEALGSDQKGPYSTASNAQAYLDAWQQAINSGESELPPEGAGVTAAPGDDGAGTTSCQIDGIGWIVCPVMKFIAKLNDMAYSFISNFLVIEPELLSQDASKVAWQSFRDFANIAFVIAFMVIVYSQITSAGVSNYGIKRMLPKLIVAAILVNISYYACQLAVDVSNLVGSSIYNMFKDVPIGPDGKAPGALTGAWEGLVGALLIGGAVIGLIALIIFAPVSLLAFAVVILILVARKAFIILLIVISPLAFVAYLLPNTEQWFKRWWKMFSTMLMVFPIIGAVFGGGYLASNILMQVAECNGADCAGDDNQMMAIVALGAMAVPLLAVPTLLKGAMAGAGAIGGKLSGLADKSSSRASKKVGERWNNTSLMRGRAIRKNAKEQYRNRKFADRIAKGGVRAKLAGGLGITPSQKFAQERLDNTAVAQVDKAREEDISAAGAKYKNIAVSDAYTMAMEGVDASTGKELTSAEHAAVVDKIMASGGFKQRQDVLSKMSERISSSPIDSKERLENQAIANRAIAAAYSKGDQNIYGTGFGDKVLKGDLGQSTETVDPTTGKKKRVNTSFVDETAQNIKDGHVSARHVVQGDTSADFLADAAVHGRATGKLNSTEYDKFKTVYDDASTNDSTRDNFTDAMNGSRSKL